MASELLRKQPKDKKIVQIISHFDEVKSLSDVVKIMGYKQSKNLTRFMFFVTISGTTKGIILLK